MDEQRRESPGPRRPATGTVAGKRLRTMAFVVFQLVIALLLLEGALRLLRPHHRGLNALLYTPSMRTAFDDVETLEELLEDTILGWVPFQNRRGFVLNSRSMRTAEYAAASRTGDQEPGPYRIMVLGDSFTFASGGVPYQQLWTLRMRQELEQSGALGELEVFELGVPGVGPRFELRLWELEHELVDPDLVILAFFAGNDFRDESKHALEPWTETLPVRWSYTYRLIRNLRRVWQGREQLRLSDSEQQVHERGGFDVGMKPEQIGPVRDDPQAYLQLEANRIQICRASQRNEFLRLAADVDDVIRRFATEVRASGADFLVVIIPDEFQVDPELRRKVLDHLQVSADEVDLDLPQRHLAGQLEEAGIPYLDLVPLFRERTRTQRLYWPNNSHWNPEGNALAGEAVADYLASSR
ncbi:MAG: SGNH/GDSL hydrolase family protein [Thermoanaerobaculia bacterium]